jgi:hypothetical protein
MPEARKRKAKAKPAKRPKVETMDACVAATPRANQLAGERIEARYLSIPAVSVTP